MIGDLIASFRVYLELYILHSSGTQQQTIEERVECMDFLDARGPKELSCVVVPTKELALSSFSKRSAGGGLPILLEGAWTKI